MVNLSGGMTAYLDNINCLNQVLFRDGNALNVDAYIHRKSLNAIGVIVILDQEQCRHIRL